MVKAEAAVVAAAALTEYGPIRTALEVLTFCCSSCPFSLLVWSVKRFYISIALQSGGVW